MVGNNQIESRLEIYAAGVVSFAHGVALKIQLM